MASEQDPPEPAESLPEEPAPGPDAKAEVAAVGPPEAAVDDAAHRVAHEIARRQLLGKMSIGLGVACGVAISTPGIGFVIAPLFLDAPREWRPVGKIEQFKVGETVNVVFVDASPLPWAGVTAKTSAWLRRVKDHEFVAFSVNCAHLGCPVRWMEQARLFMCPCHGGVYYEDGRVAAGPPPHPLTQYPVRVEAGQVEIRTDPIPIG